MVAAVPQFILTLRTTRRRSYFEEFPMEQKSGESPLMVAAVPQFILTLRTTRRRSCFEEFPMEQKIVFSPENTI